MILVLLFIVLVILLVLLLKQLKKHRLSKIHNLLDNVMDCYIGYSYYCLINGKDPIIVIPKTLEGLQLFTNFMLYSRKSLALENWFTQEQIEAINIGNDTLTDLNNRGLINKASDVVPLMTQYLTEHGL